MNKGINSYSRLTNAPNVILKILSKTYFRSTLSNHFYPTSQLS